jgi:hypothetical protein
MFANDSGRITGHPEVIHMPKALSVKITGARFSTNFVMVMPPRSERPFTARKAVDF